MNNLEMLIADGDSQGRKCEIGKGGMPRYAGGGGLLDNLVKTTSQTNRSF